MMPIKIWLHLILSTLIVISDRDYQDRIWVHGSDEKIVDSYVETMSNLFDEGDVKNFIEHHTVEAGLTYQQTIELKKVVDAIDVYDGSKLTHKELLKDTQWIKITDMVKETLKILPPDTLGKH